MGGERRMSEVQRYTALMSYRVTLQNTTTLPGPSATTYNTTTLPGRNTTNWFGATTLTTWPGVMTSAGRVENTPAATTSTTGPTATTWLEMVRMTFTIMNIRYDYVILNKALERAVKASIANAIAVATGIAAAINIQSDHVRIVLAPGSLVVIATISIPLHLPAPYVITSLEKIPIESFVVDAVLEVDN